MSVLIRGMELPESCGRCPLKRRNGIEFFCPAANENFSVADVNIFECRLDRCPLIEVPEPHGRLIDVDALGFTDFEIVMCSSFKQLLEDLLEKIEAAPTIIPPDPAKEGE